MPAKVISLKHAKLQKRDEEMDVRNKNDRLLENLVDDVLKWWTTNGYGKEIPDFVLTAIDINEIGVYKYMAEQLEYYCE